MNQENPHRLHVHVGDLFRTVLTENVSNTLQVIVHYTTSCNHVSTTVEDLEKAEPRDLGGEGADCGSFTCFKQPDLVIMYMHFECSN